jgi:hypothetical protein
MNHRIILYTHNRALYFQQTLDGLLYSLDGYNIPITIVLNAPDVATLSVAQKVQDRCDVLITEENCAFAAQTIGVRWSNPEVITIVQDDHILPPLTKHYYPNWPSLFEKKLLFGNDVVYFGCSLDNVPIPNPFAINTPESEDESFVYFERPGSNPPVFLFDPCTMKTSFWWSCYNGGPKCAVDSAVIAKSKRMARAKLVKTYHIGWNGSMNNYNDRNDWAKAFHLPMTHTKVRNLKTGEVREISLDKD